MKKNLTTILAPILGIALMLYFLNVDPSANIIGINGADVMRLFTISLVVIIWIATAFIITAYYKARRVTKDKMGLLPNHVWKIGLSYLVISASAVSNNVSRLGLDVWTWHVPVNMLGFGLGIIALLEILRFERRRIR